MKIIAMIILLLACGNAYTSEITQLRESCRQLALAEDARETNGFGICDDYHQAAKSSPADALVSGLYMEMINLHRNYERPIRYLRESGIAADALGNDSWVAPELVSLLLNSERFDYTTSADIFMRARERLKQQGVTSGPEWAALQIGAAHYLKNYRIKTPTEREEQRQELLSTWPQVMRQIQALPPDAYRQNLELWADIGWADLHEKNDASIAFDALISAWHRAQQQPAELSYVQLLLSNLLTDHQDLVPDRRDPIWKIVKDPAEDKFKDRLIKSLAQSETECLPIAELHEMARRYSPSSEAERTTPASRLMLYSMYGFTDRIYTELRTLSCLSPAQLQLEDEQGDLAKALRQLFPPAKRDGEMAQWLKSIETNLKKR